jgi:hypothetical protein
MEASWNRLRAISGAETPEQVVEYWQGKDASRHWNVQAMFLAMLAECQAGIASIANMQCRNKAGISSVDLLMCIVGHCCRAPG